MVNLSGNPLKKMAFAIRIFIECGVSPVPQNGILLEDFLIYLPMTHPKLHRKLVSEKEIAPRIPKFWLSTKQFFLSIRVQ